jgi:hypothetical protein
MDIITPTGILYVMMDGLEKYVINKDAKKIVTITDSVITEHVIVTMDSVEDFVK